MSFAYAVVHGETPDVYVAEDLDTLHRVLALVLTKTDAVFRLFDGKRSGLHCQHTGYTLGTRGVCNRCMSKVRVNIEIEDRYLEAIMDRFHLRTKTEAVDLALRHLAGQPMTREEALAMRDVRAIGKVPVDSGPPSL